MKKRLSPAQQRMLLHACELAELGLPFRMPEGYRHYEQGGYVLASHLLDEKGAYVSTLGALMRRGYLKRALVVRTQQGPDLLLAVPPSSCDNLTDSR